MQFAGNDIEAKMASAFMQRVGANFDRRKLKRLSGSEYNCVFEAMYDLTRSLAGKDDPEFDEWEQEQENIKTQAAYELHRAGNCEWSDGSKPAWTCWIPGRSPHAEPCAERHIDCPLHKGADDDS